MFSIFTVIFLLYGALQLYVVDRVQAGMALAWPVTAALVVWAALMTVMPLLVWRWERRGWHRAVAAGEWVGHTWMGVTFLFFWVSVALELTRGAFDYAGIDTGLSPQGWFVLSCGLTSVLVVYGLAAARHVMIEHVTLPTTKLSPDSTTLRIALISDVHLGALVGARRLRAVLDKVRALDPDVLVSAGDLVDGQADYLNGLAEMLAAYTPRCGKYAVTGNHEYFVGLSHALRFHERAGFRLLRGEAVEVAGAFAIAGVDDPVGVRLGMTCVTDEALALGQCPAERFTILLKHQPRIDDGEINRVDLQLSGHVHKGQIFPFGLLVRLFYPLGTGLRRIPGGGWIYVSRGTGTWGPPMRVAAAPEITFIEVVPARR